MNNVIDKVDFFTMKQIENQAIRTIDCESTASKMFESFLEIRVSELNDQLLNLTGREGDDYHPPEAS